ncbi:MULTISPECIES: LysM peptidoglycan-binding domain-containing protein [Polaribacter]|uniref:LysM peptidoglycan-binding domain-containing protein n=1 Tax=Polaribacter TaxID=52959 RepID=UPI002091641E|nr:MULTISPECIES: LysM peptidoglycan-binding domain-containing protein [Polaribacter]
MTFTVSCGQQKRYIQYKVQQGETMSKIAEKLAMKTPDLKRLNPDVEGEPRANTFLVVPEKKLNNFKNQVKESAEVVSDSIVNTSDLNEEEKLLEEIKEKFVVYEVKKGDTFYSLNKTFDVSRGELLQLNPELKEGLKVGMLLKIKEIPLEIVSEEIFYSDYIDRNKDLKVALLLPFRTHKYRNDSLTLKEIFDRNSTLLNITTDFYLGAEIAIDSLRRKGVNIEFNVYDTGDRRSNQITNIISRNNLNSNDVVIGPLYSEEVRTVASNVNIPVIYPVYSDDQSGFSSSNIVKTSPEKKVFREELEKYIIENFNKVETIEDNNTLVDEQTIIETPIIEKGNIIIVTDESSASKQSSRTIQNNLNFGLDAVVNILSPQKGYIAKERFLELLKPNAKNWVIIATDKNVAVSDAINSLISLPEETTVKVFTFDKGRVYDKIDNRKLAKIGFTYVSDEFVDENSLNTRIFNQQYQKKNKALPSFYATKGFDITYDILIRLASGYDLKSTLNEGMSVRIESKFDYRNSTYLAENQGLFIVQYNKDLSLTRLK